MLLISCTAIVVAVLTAACSRETSAELDVTARINLVRENAGLRPLTPDASLVDIARRRSEDMAANGYFSHRPPDGCDYVCMMSRIGVPYSYAGETIAWNTYDWPRTAGAAVALWENSAPHLEKMLDCHYVRFGTGVAQAPDGRIYFTTIFEGNAAC